jgi:putative colanic acid biosynthesis acetyltransferase WcaF
VNRDLSAFSGSAYFTFPRKIQLGTWLCAQHIIFKSAFFPSSLRPLLLKLFGASVGRGVIIRRGVRVHFPWNLEIGDYCWIGEEVWFINHEKVSIGSNVCISQRSIVCSGGHDYQSTSLEYAHKPVVIKDGAWICLDAKVLPGVTIGQCSVISASEVVRKSIPNYAILVDGKIHTINAPK